MHTHKGALGSNRDLGSSTGLIFGSAPLHATPWLCGKHPMRGPHYDRIMASMALSLMLATPLGAFAQEAQEVGATFNERFPADQTSTQPSLEVPEIKREQTTITRAVRVKRPRSRVVVVPRSFLNAGTKMTAPGERKFLDYAFPPTYAALDVVSNTGGRVGWHNSPLPGPFFPR
jgi:hypothetical protein